RCGDPRLLPLPAAARRKAAAADLSDLDASGLALALARHVRLVHAALPVEVPLSRSVPLVPVERASRRADLRRSDPHARHEGGRGVTPVLLEARDVATSGAIVAPRPHESLRVVAIGGGTGLPVVLRSVKNALFPLGQPWVSSRDRERLTAIVTAADDG